MGDNVPFWDKELHPHTPNRGWKIKRNRAVKAKMKQLDISNKDVSGARVDSETGNITFTYKTHPLTKKQSGSVTQPLPKDHWTKEKRKTGRERAEEAFKDMKHGGSVKKYARGGGIRKARTYG